MSLPALSICIPTFDRLGYLREAVASARAQTLASIEILIGDDGESEELRDWCRAIAAEDRRVRYEKTPRRLGLAGNWNFLAAQARAPFLTLIGDDDRLLPTFAEHLVGQADETTDVVFCNHYMIDGQGRRLDDATRETAQRYGRAGLAPGPLKQSAKLVWQGVVPMSASIIRAAEVCRLGFKNDINTPELELCVRLAFEGRRFVFVDEHLAEYRIHVGSATARGLTIDRLAEYLEKVPVPIDVERSKRECLQPLLVAGVSARLQRGDAEGARSLTRSSYYPRSAQPRLLVQRFMLMLPNELASAAYTFLGGVARTLRGTWNRSAS